MIYLELFWCFFQIGLFSIGGGYAAMPLIRYQVVEVHDWLTMAEFADIITISQMTPGPISINSATFVGINIAGIPGALVATFGCVLPSCLIVLALAFAYYRFRGFRMVRNVLLQLRAAVVSMIAFAGLAIVFLAFWHKETAPSFADFPHTDWVAVFIFGAALVVLRRWRKVDPIHVMLGTGVLGIVLYLLPFWAK